MAYVLEAFPMFTDFTFSHSSHKKTSFSTVSTQVRSPQKPTTSSEPHNQHLTDNLVDEMQKPDVQREKRLDPMLHLNEDIRNIVFDHLCIDDILHSTSVSQTWQCAVQVWMNRSRRRVGRMLRPFCHATVPPARWRGLTDGEIRYHATSLRQMQSADATSTLTYGCPKHSIHTGNFFACCHSPTALYWQPARPSIGLARTSNAPRVSRQGGNEQDLTAINFRTSKTVYRLPVLDSHWRRSLFPKGIDTPGMNRVQVVHVINGEEFLILNYRPVNVYGPSTVKIIRGRDGHLVQSIDFADSWPCCLADPLTGQGALIWTVHPADLSQSLVKHHRILKCRNTTLFRTFTTTPEQEIAMSDVAVVLHDSSRRGCEALQPFTMTAIGYDTYPDDCRPKWMVTRRPLIPIQDKAHANAAQALARWFFQSNAVKVSGCFQLGAAVVLSRPITKKEGGTGLVKVSVTAGLPLAMYWVDHACLSLVDALCSTTALDFT
ncbi:hypothetical protein BDW62DRAFT_204013 [Aspergillus aurantiobrunneus]